MLLLPPLIGIWEPQSRIQKRGGIFNFSPVQKLKAVFGTSVAWYCQGFGLYFKIKVFNFVLRPIATSGKSGSQSAGCDKAATLN